MRQAISWGVVGAALVACACASSAPAGPASLTRGPYLQLLTTHSVTIVWQTSVAAPCIVGVTAGDGPARTVSGAVGTVCAVAVDGLTPGASYTYTALAGESPIAPPATFRTDDPARPFTFAVLGDSGSGSADQDAVRDRMLAASPDFVLSTGDMVYEDGAAADFDPEFFIPYGALLTRVVFWPVLGNHDLRTDNGRPWRDAFYTPANNPAQDEGYYSFDYGNAHVAVIDSNAETRPGSPQYVFLDGDLGASAARWKFVAFHHPVYSIGKRHGSALQIRKNLVPLFDRHRVDMVFSGHNHVFERSRPLRNFKIVPVGEGTIYVTTGGGGKTLQGLAPAADFTAAAEIAFHFMRVAVDSDTLRTEMVRKDGSVGDTLTVAKKPGAGDAGDAR